MDMTSTWRAVLLIDEADVFLERRSLHDLHRNAMVSVFLRVLEYYAGMFLFLFSFSPSRLLFRPTCSAAEATTLC